MQWGKCVSTSSYMLSSPSAAPGRRASSSSKQSSVQATSFRRRSLRACSFNRFRAIPNNQGRTRFALSNRAGQIKPQEDFLRHVLRVVRLKQPCAKVPEDGGLVSLNDGFKGLAVAFDCSFDEILVQHGCFRGWASQVGEVGRRIQKSVGNLKLRARRNRSRRSPSRHFVLSYCDKLSRGLQSNIKFC